jgi:hypothetical protein
MAIPVCLEKKFQAVLPNDVFQSRRFSILSLINVFAGGADHVASVLVDASTMYVSRVHHMLLNYRIGNAKIKALHSLAACPSSYVKQAEIYIFLVGECLK